MLDLEGPSPTARERDLLRHPAVGGVILFARNVGDRGQVTELTAELREARPGLLLAVDQEGGRVQRLREGYTRFPPMATLGRYLAREGEGAEQLLRDCGWLLASEVLASGLDFSFTPVLDVDDQTCAVISDRAFAADPHLAARAARLFIEGLHEAGMAATGKHFPGHGGVGADSHLETPVDNRSLDRLRERDLVPFATLATDLDAVMPAHILFPQVDDSCVGFSRRWLHDILRGELGFNGVIFSDDLSMKGADMAGGYAEKSRAALAAGCDMVLVCNSPTGTVEVLDDLDSTGFSPSPRLPSMAARSRPAWRDLADCDRRLATVDRIARIQPA